MQRYEGQVQGVADTHHPQEIETAPPAYAPHPMTVPEQQDAHPSVPLKDLPASLIAESKPSPAAPPGPQPAQGVTPLNQLGDHPQWIDCPFCQRRTMTRVNKEGTPMQIVAGALLCLFCVCLACVPCVAGWFEETNYFCAECHNKVAKKPDGGAIVVYGPQAVVPSKYAQA
ncbi:hypothetical protein VTK56DRAFT_863 [Thermocarpiscus australiensis]